MADLFDIVVARKLSGGGGGSWTVLTEESVTTVSQGGFNGGELSYIFTSEPPAKLRITFNGTAYECDAIVGNTYLYGGVGPDGPDFSQYPFALQVSESGTILFTATAGTHTVKLEVQQGGGSSDFSTAQILIIDNTGPDGEMHSFGNLINLSEGQLENAVSIHGGQQLTVTAVLYYNYLSAYIETSDTITATGDIEVEADSGYVDLYISGDGTITIS